VTAERLAQAAGPVAAAGLVALLVLPGRWVRLAGLALALAGAALTVPLLLPAGDRVTLAAAGAAGLGACLVVAGVLRRWPWGLALLALACMPARIPVRVGGEEANLLVPLYVVVGGGVLLLAWDLAAGDARRAELGPLAYPLAALAAWLCGSAAWSDDPREASIRVLFFLVPFALLAVLVARLPWRPVRLRGLYALLAALAVLFAVVGIVQWSLREVWWNPKVEVGNTFGALFRVNSLFWDPSIYGRFLAVVLAVTLGLLMLRRQASSVLVAATVLVALAWVGLLFSHSQSSFLALGAGVVLAAVLAWRWRAVLAVAAAAAVLVPVGLAAPPLERVRDAVANNLDDASSGRYGLVRTGFEIAVDHPAAGVGLGGFPLAYAESKGLGKPPDFARSHATPVTVAAEQGFVGLAALVWLLAVTAGAAFRLPAASRDARDLARLAGLVVAVVFVHSLFYDAFFEDPMVWSALGLVALARASRTDLESTRLEVGS
jgi:O-antigen ligase